MTEERKRELYQSWIKAAECPKDTKWRGLLAPEETEFVSQLDAGVPIVASAIAKATNESVRHEQLKKYDTGVAPLDHIFESLE